MATVIINGATYKGSDISICNGKVIVDGKDVTSERKEINITIEGDVENLSIDTCSKLEISGSCNKIRTKSGNVKCLDVKGDIQTTSGDVSCGHVNGDVNTTSGDVTADAVSGNIRTMSGDIYTRKSPQSA